MLEKDLKKEFLKRKIEEFFKSLEETEEEIIKQEEEEEEEETNLTIKITDESTSIEGVGNITTLLNGVVALARLLEQEHGVDFDKLSKAVKLAKVIHDIDGL